MDDKAAILLVDDESFSYEILKNVLSSEFQLYYVSSGQACLEFVKQNPIDIILLDILMPDMDGYETCKKLKNDPATSDIWVCYVSALDSIEERLQGYNAGGDDYVTKPFSIDELHNKIKIAVKHQQEKESLQKDVNNAVSTAMTAMTASGELGVVLQFLRDCSTSTGVNELAQVLLSAVKQYGLNSSVQIRTSAQVFTKASSGVANALEEELLWCLKDNGRIFDFGRRTLFNFSSLSLLVKNMPESDPDRYGRLKDNIAILVEEAEYRFKALETAIEVKNQKETLRLMLANTESVLESISANYAQNQKQTIQVMDELLEDLESTFMRLGLTEEQEKALLGLTQNGVDKALSYYETGLDIDEHLGKLIDILEQGLKEK